MAPQNYKDRDVILTKARSMEDELMIDNSKISLFPDFSPDLQRQREKFQVVNKHLHYLNVPICHDLSDPAIGVCNGGNACFQ